MSKKSHRKEIQERRENVSHLLLLNKTETQIAKELGVSRETIVRDVGSLKKSAYGWVEALAKDGFIFEYKQALDKIKTREAKLNGLLDEAKDVWQKIAVMKELDRNTKLYLELLGESPTIHSFRKAMRKDNVQET